MSRARRIRALGWVAGGALLVIAATSCASDEGIGATADEGIAAGDVALGVDEGAPDAMDDTEDDAADPTPDAVPDTDSSPMRDTTPDAAADATADAVPDPEPDVPPAPDSAVTDTPDSGADSEDVPLAGDGGASDAGDGSEQGDIAADPGGGDSQAPTDTVDTSSPDADPDVASDAISDSPGDVLVEADVDAGPDPLWLAVPPGTVARMEGDACPAGWRRVSEADGRMLKGAADPADVGVTAGAPLAPGEVRMHTHDYSSSVSVPSAGIAGITGCCNDTVGGAGTIGFGGTSSPSGPELPTSFGLICQREDDMAGPADGHPFPEGSVLFFDAPTCPSGWFPVPEAAGRFIVPTPPGGTPGQVVGSPLARGQLPSHTHGFSGAIDVPQQSLAALGGGNNNHARRGQVGFSGSTTPAEAATPYIEYLACEAGAPDLDPSTPTTGDEVPPGTMAFFRSTECPEGWADAGDATGRFLVGLTEGATPTNGGGGPLGPGEDRLHAHRVSGLVDVPARSVALASGCCYGETGGRGPILYDVSTDAVSSGVPYLSLLGCVRPPL